VRITNSLSPVAVGGSIVVACITMYALGGQVRQSVWLGWTTLITLCIVVLIALALGYRRVRPMPDTAARWALRYELVGTVNGLAWGMLGLIIAPAQGSVSHTIYLFVVAALTAGGVSALAPIFSVFLGFTLPIVLGAIYRCLQVSSG
jgi:hypothetical protein